MEEYQKQIEDLKAQVESLQQANERLQEKLNLALDGTGLCLWEQHVPSGTLTIFNMEWGKMLGFQSNELTATVDTWKSKLHPEDYDLAVGAFEDHLAGKTDLYEVVHRMIHKDGSDSWVSDRGRIVEYDSNGKPLRMMGTHVDITQEKRYEQQLAKLANSDPLTGLLNRSAFEQSYLTHSLPSNSKCSALVFIDIDNFKSVNDQLGHQAGDKLLIQIAGNLERNAIPGSIVARLGGDEFVMLSHIHNQNQIQEFCDTLLAHVTPEIQPDSPYAKIGFSIGVCLFSGTQYRFDEIYEKADSAMYKVKKGGKNGVAYVDLCES